MEGLSEVCRFAAGSTSDAAAALKRDGAVILDNIWDAARIDDLRSVVEAQHPEFADKALLGPDHLDTGKGRFIAPVTVTPEITSCGILNAEPLIALFTATLAEGWVYEAFGMMMTLSGAAEQGKHRDAPVLFPETPLARILPPFALTVAIPLVDVGPDNGPTAILLGTHKFEIETHQGEPAIPEVRRGSVLIWNFSTMHWGMPNTTGRPRPALYITVCRPFWTDSVNFGRKTARTRLAVAEEVRELLGKPFIRAEVRG